MITLLSTSLFLSSCSPQEEARATDVDMKVMSFNIHSGIGEDNAYDLDRIANVIRESKAEVIGLQEVDVHWASRSRLEHEVRQLAHKLEMNSFFAPIYDLPPKREGEPNRQFGVAILSKYPILDAKNREMTRLSTQVPNPAPESGPGLAEVLLDVHGVHVKVYSTHLDFRPEAAIRSIQVKEMLKAMSENEYEKIVLGDFNAKTTNPELAPLFSTFYDTWAHVRSDPGFTFPAQKPNRKIDHILVSRGIRTKSADIVQTLASDHRPIVTEVTVPAKVRKGGSAE
jgi:endonuclease/exonuclease/phosphatase family metal-dependent hydrolase